MNLPKAGEKISVGELIHLCTMRGWYYHLAKIEDKQPGGCFVSDGCSMFPDEWREKSIYEACFKHDILYWMGGTEREREFADAILRDDVERLTGDQVLAAMMHAGVRVGGSPDLDTPWRWGYGKETV